jgi:hypothetical protein
MYFLGMFQRRRRFMDFPTFFRYCPITLGSPQAISGSASALGAQKPGLFALLFLTTSSKKQQLGESALRSKQISKHPSSMGSDTVLTQEMDAAFVAGDRRV